MSLTVVERLTPAKFSSLFLIHSVKKLPTQLDCCHAVDKRKATSF